MLPTQFNRLNHLSEIVLSEMVINSCCWSYYQAREHRTATCRKGYWLIDLPLKLFSSSNTTTTCSILFNHIYIYFFDHSILDCVYKIGWLLVQQYTILSIVAYSIGHLFVILFKWLLWSESSDRLTAAVVALRIC